jgi:hypothetical protein
VMHPMSTIKFLYLIKLYFIALSNLTNPLK